MTWRGGPPPDDRRCRYIVPARTVRGIAWAPEHRCMHTAKPNGFRRQHQPDNEPDELGQGTDQQAGVADRCKTVGGSFFDAVPAGADAYVMKRVIHDWDDEQAIAILRPCRSVMVDGAKLLLVEQIIRQGNTPDPAKFTDLMMLVMQGGKERTADEFGRLLAAAGFRLSGVTPMSGPFSVIEGVPV